MHWSRVWNPETTSDWAISTALLPLSWLYGLGWRSYAAVYQLGLKRRRSFQIPILGIGNLEVGGTGKTPIAIAAARLFPGRRIGISSSAYGSPSSKGASFAPLEMAPRVHGDEACVIRSKLPDVTLILGRDRVAAAELAESVKMDLLILDDGFQHLPLARTSDMVIWNPDAKNRRLLPAGPFREPRSGVHRADGMFVSNERVDDKPSFAFRRVFTDVKNTATGERFPTNWLSGQTISAACAIAKPDDFFRQLESLGANIDRRIALPDHSSLANFKWNSEALWVVTEKDAVKISPAANIYALEMDVEFCEQEALTDWLNRKLFP